jgi:DNA-binding protein HU-beta
VTKAELLAEVVENIASHHVYKDLKIEQQEAEAVLEILLETIQKVMEKGDNIYMRGFGSFINKKRAKKTGRNITKNTTIEIPAHFIPAFKPSKNFIEKVKKSEKLKKMLEKGEKPK